MAEMSTRPRDSPGQGQSAGLRVGGVAGWLLHTLVGLIEDGLEVGDPVRFEVGALDRAAELGEINCCPGGVRAVLEEDDDGGSARFELVADRLHECVVEL